VTCPDGATIKMASASPIQNAIATSSDVSGGCTSGGAPGILLGCAGIALVIAARRRRALLAIVIAACSLDCGQLGRRGRQRTDRRLDDLPDVFAADLGETDGAQYLLADQQPIATARQPVAQFSLMRTATVLPILRITGACGDRLVNATGLAPNAELLGWSRAQTGDGTAELVELQAPDHCTYKYETDPEAINCARPGGYQVSGSHRSRVAAGHGRSGGATTDVNGEDRSSRSRHRSRCQVTKHSAAILLYASPGKVEALRFLLGCPAK